MEDTSIFHIISSYDRRVESHVQDFVKKTQLLRHVFSNIAQQNTATRKTFIENFTYKKCFNLIVYILRKLNIDF